MGYEEERHWYVVQTYSGLENIAKTNIELRTKSLGMEDRIFNVLVPVVKKVQKNAKGEEKEVLEKPYPGYLFIEMICTLEAWFMVRNTEKVTGFIGSSGGGALPVPMQDDEIIPILKMCGMTVERKFNFEVGETVIIARGSFAGQEGEISSIDYEREVVKVFIDAFGRKTGVELGVDEITKKK